MPRYNSHKTLTVRRIEDNEIGPTPRSKFSPTPIRSLKRKPNFCHQKPFSCEEKEPWVEDVGDAQIQCGRSTFEIPTRDKSDLEHDGSDFGDDEIVLGDGESELEDGKSDLEVILTPDLKEDESVLGDNESDLEDFPMRNTAFVNPSRHDYLELSLLIFDPWHPYNPRRWALLLEDQFLNVEYCYQLLERPIVGKPYEFRYDPGELGSFREPDERHHITWIRRRDKTKVYRTVSKAQLQFSQRWVLEIIWNLESQEIVLPGKGNALRMLEQEDRSPREKVDMVLVIEKEKARPFHKKLSDWARGQPDAVSKIRERMDCRMVELVISFDPTHKYRVMLHKRTSSMEDYYAHVRHALVQVAKRIIPFNWPDDGHKPHSSECPDCPYSELYLAFAAARGSSSDAPVAQDSHLDG
ncbi:uncharacterized protein B0J16DRAFT_391579 [Fusarium flagelliforme]|uniref:Uncharacterized protein n=1 Tax=Fusarium flagelliforme TaxID=2675880 RepID=A0A395N623_9HYPO|nr:uncharacterized protein B0J16DRAFT_391579 [Fusarium flagelliforme]KAH7197868.1 hypothetical protein B0J16DRAFT_391579 [Fusarium flagelliforme]RFN55320.1 hypothetical protein FIE12Z_356 [Fusarium flagelliforme]